MTGKAGGVGMTGKAEWVRRTKRTVLRGAGDGSDRRSENAKIKSGGVSTRKDGQNRSVTYAGQEVIRTLPKRRYLRAF